MADAPTMRALTELLAGQTRAEERHTALMERLDQSDDLLRQVMQGLTGMTVAFGTLRETVNKLSEAANAEKPKQGKDLAMVLAGLTAELKKQGKSLDRAVVGIEALPGLLSAKGIATEDRHQSNGGAASAKRDGGNGDAD